MSKVILIASAAFAVNAAFMEHLGKAMPNVTFETAPDSMREGILAAVADRLANPNAMFPDGMEGDALLQERLFRAVVDTLNGMPLAESAPPSSGTIAQAVLLATPDGFLPVKYIGRRPTYRDGAYGTGLEFVQGETKLVPTEKARKLLQHPDVYILGEAGTLAQPAAQEVSDKEQQELVTEQRLQEARDEVAAMREKSAVATFIKTNFAQDVEVGAKVRLDDLKAKATQLIDQFGMPA